MAIQNDHFTPDTEYLSAFFDKTPPSGRRLVYIDGTDISAFFALIIALGAGFVVTTFLHAVMGG